MIILIVNSVSFKKYKIDLNIFKKNIPIYRTVRLLSMYGKPFTQSYMSILLKLNKYIHSNNFHILYIEFSLLTRNK